MSSISDLATPAEAPSSEALRAGIERFARSRPSDGTLTWITVPAPSVNAARLLEAAPSYTQVFWSPPSDTTWIGCGSAIDISARGQGRFADVQRATVRWQRNVVAQGLGPRAPEPRWFGGFAFQPDRAKTVAWRDFGEALFVLPRCSYIAQRGRAWLGVALIPNDTERLDEVLAEVAQFESGIAQAQGTRVENLSRLEVTEREDAPTEEAFHEFVRELALRIQSGEFEKVVLARCARLKLEQRPPASRILDELRQEHVTLFAFQRGPAIFLGATPENLVSRAGRRVQTEAVAGSIRSETIDAAEILFASSKDRQEHELVVREILVRLQPLVESIDHARVPRVRRLRHLLHLATPINAVLSHEHHVLDLVERLHPTPAVGGIPVADALAWIRDHEPEERGWYAGPVGWFDRNGDGQFAVALRSGLFTESEARLFAGAGIVSASDPAAEHAETGLKLASLLNALGVRP